ncbi:MAG TPA: DUF2069 domain-containing protein [Burkholderiales bacterium]|nr:DUF2069 domain-containing protein [Burkholderiales bacterium]
MRAARTAASASLLALIFLCVDWELWLAPLRPGGSLLALKAIPLVFCLPGVLRGRRYTCQWACMLVLAYFAEGVVRAYSESGAHRAAAWAEIALAVVFFAAAIACVRASRDAAA